MPIRSRRLALALLGAPSLLLVAASCADGDGSDPERTGPTKQAVERLHDYGLTNEAARCIVDEVGAESVVEATDLNALTESEQYRDAAKACLDDA